MRDANSVQPSGRDGVSLKIATIYLALGAAWTLLSDRLLAALVADVHTFALLETLKGWAYVAFTAVLL
jgi:hypothetical protein